MSTDTIGIAECDSCHQSTTMTSRSTRIHRYGELVSLPNFNLWVDLKHLRIPCSNPICDRVIVHFSSDPEFERAERLGCDVDRERQPDDEVFGIYLRHHELAYVVTPRMDQQVADLADELAAVSDGDIMAIFSQPMPKREKDLQWIDGQSRPTVRTTSPLKAT